MQNAAPSEPVQTTSSTFSSKLKKSPLIFFLVGALLSLFVYGGLQLQAKTAPQTCNSIFSCGTVPYGSSQPLVMYVDQKTFRDADSDSFDVITKGDWVQPESSTPALWDDNFAFTLSNGCGGGQTVALIETPVIDDVLNVKITEIPLAPDVATCMAVLYVRKSFKLPPALKDRIDTVVLHDSKNQETYTVKRN